MLLHLKKGIINQNNINYIFIRSELDRAIVEETIEEDDDEGEN